MSSPFTPFQRMVILVVAGISALSACWYLLRAFHPRSRSPEFRYAPLGLAVILGVCAVECVMVIFAKPLVTRHLIWLPVLAVVGLTIQCLAGLCDKRRQRALPPAVTNPQVPEESRKSDLALIHNAAL